MDQQNSRYSRVLKRQKTHKQSTAYPNDNLNTTVIIETSEGDNNCKSMCDSSSQVNFECIPNNSFVFACSFEGNSVKCYGGRSSDSFITNYSGFLSKLEPGDQILADKGFPGIKTNVENQNAILVMPHILHHGKFTEEEVLETHSIASVRIHVERFFARLKVYGILNKVPI